jgi:glycosyltransferase involved in cell wall biosynthesis
MTSDQITIAIPVFNRDDFFHEAINSVLNQTIKPKIIIVDNASEHDKFENYVNNLNDPGVNYFRNAENVGMVGNWNKCIEYSDTPWISILHDDDALHIRFVELMLKVIEQEPETGLVGAKTWVGEKLPAEITQKSIPVVQGKYLKPSYFLYKNISPFPGIVFKKELGEKLNGYKPDFHPISDLDFWYRISCIAPAIQLENKLAWYRISPQQETYSKIRSIIDVTVEIREKIMEETAMKSRLEKASVNYEHQNLLQYYINTYHLDNLESRPSFYSKTRLGRKFMNYYVRKKSFKDEFYLS